MKAKFLILLSMVLLFGCRSTKTVTEMQSSLQVNSSAAVNQNDSSSFIQDKIIKTETDISIENVSSDSVLIKETITELSKPDSLGNQYPTRVIDRETVKVSSDATHETQETNTTEESNIGITEYSETTTESSTEINQDTSQNITEEKTGIGIPLELVLPIVIAILVLVVFIRLGGFKWLFGVLGL